MLKMTPNSQEPLRPQLLMRGSLAHLLTVQLPNGYELRTYRPGDAAAWERIIDDSFQMDMSNDFFGRCMRNDFAYRPERIFLVCFGGEAVATASAWYKPEFGKDTGYLHMVGVLR